MSVPKAPKEKDVGRKQFSLKEYKLLCDWLEIDGNLDSIQGTEGKTKVGVQYHTKKLAFESMAQYINERQYKGSDLAKVDFQGAKNRFNHLTAKYRRIKQQSESTGFGVTEADEAGGVFSIAAKLEKLCPCFDRLDCIFGHKPKADTQGNLYVSSLVGEENGMAPDDFLSVHNTTQNGPVIIDLDLPNTAEPGDPEVTPLNPETTTPTTPMESNLEWLRRPSAESSMLEGQGEGQQEGQVPHCQDSSPQPANAAVPDSSVRSKHTIHKGSASNMKRRSIEKNAGLTGTFAHSMEMLSAGKLKSLEMKEKVLEQRATTAAIRAEVAQQQMAFEEKRLCLEEKKLEHIAMAKEAELVEGKRARKVQARIEEKKLEQDAMAKEAELAEGKRAHRVQARIDVIAANSHRPPHELAETIAMECGYIREKQKDVQILKLQEEVRSLQEEMFHERIVHDECRTKEVRLLQKDLFRERIVHEECKRQQSILHVMFQEAVALLQKHGLFGKEQPVKLPVERDLLFSITGQ